MRLADFILSNIEPILVQWEAFARTLAAGATMDPLALRDHAEQILRATAHDMMSAQTDGERSEKSKGHGHATADSVQLNGASDAHGDDRVASGFDLLAVVAEYRALRASVVQLWRQSHPNPDLRDIDDLTRFHESIDQSLAEAVRSFTERMNRSRQMFLAILGHDLRNPLNAMTLSAKLMQEACQLDAEGSRLAAGISNSAEAMGQMMNDLLDFTGAGLGASMPLKPAAMDLQRLAQEVSDEMRSGNPKCKFQVEMQGDLTGTWDRARLRQLISNLLGNAVQHGAADCSVGLRVSEDGANVRIDVHNHGAPIPPEALTTIFDPLVRVLSPELQRQRRPGSIGLGLYIAREVVTSHGGEISVTSSKDAGTTFTVRLPRRRAKG